MRISVKVLTKGKDGITITIKSSYPLKGHGLVNYYDRILIDPP